MPSPAVAVIDIGSNSIKSLVARLDSDGRPVSCNVSTLDTRISEGLSRAEPRLSENGMTAGLAAIETLLTEIAAFSPSRIALVATSAVRDATNGAEFCTRVKTVTGHTIRILTGEQEANLIGRGLTCDPALATFQDFYVFDLGGGSLECLAFRGRQIEQATSLPLGCVRLTEKWIDDPTTPVPAGALTAIDQAVRQTLAASGFRFELAGGAAVFAGGSITTVRAILAARSGKTLTETAPHVPVSTLRTLLDELASLPLSERQTVPGLPSARADVFPTALRTAITLAEVVGLTGFHHSFYNLRWGLAAELLSA